MNNQKVLGGHFLNFQVFHNLVHDCFGIFTEKRLERHAINFPVAIPIREVEHGLPFCLVFIHGIPQIEQDLGTEFIERNFQIIALRLYEEARFRAETAPQRSLRRG